MYAVEETRQEGEEDVTQMGKTARQQWGGLPGQDGEDESPDMSGEDHDLGKTSRREQGGL